MSSTCHTWAGSCAATVVLDGADGPELSFVAPRVFAPSELHVVLTVTDSGEPPLVAYRRVVVTIAP